MAELNGNGGSHENGTEWDGFFLLEPLPPLFLAASFQRRKPGGSAFVHVVGPYRTAYSTVHSRVRQVESSPAYGTVGSSCTEYGTDTGYFTLSTSASPVTAVPYRITVHIVLCGTERPSTVRNTVRLPVADPRQATWMHTSESPQRVNRVPSHRLWYATKYR